MGSCILFNYPDKVQTSIHKSVLFDPVLWIVRTFGLVLMIIRMGMYDGGSGKGYTLLFLTDYGFILTLIYFTIVTIHLVISKVMKRSSAINFIGECINIVFESAFVIEFVLTLLFWILLSEGQNELWEFDNLGLHLYPLLYLLVDFLLNSYAFPIRHITITFTLAIIYIIINQIHACSVRPVYDVFECGNVWIPAVAFLIITFIHMMGYLVWKFWRRDKIRNKIRRQEEQSLIQS